MAHGDTDLAGAHGSSGGQRAGGQQGKGEGNLRFWWKAKPGGPSTAICHHCPKTSPGDGISQGTGSPTVDPGAIRKGPKPRPPSRCPPESGSTWPPSPESPASSSSSCHPRSCPFSRGQTHDISQDPARPDACPPPGLGRGVAECGMVGPDGRQKGPKSFPSLSQLSHREGMWHEVKADDNGGFWTRVRSSTPPRPAYQQG